MDGSIVKSRKACMAFHMQVKLPTTASSNIYNHMGTRQSLTLLAFGNITLGTSPSH